MRTRKFLLFLTISLVMVIGMMQVQSATAPSGKKITVTIKKIALLDDGDIGQGEIYLKRDSSNLGDVGDFYGGFDEGQATNAKIFDTPDKSYSSTYSSSKTIKFYQYDDDPWPNGDDQLLRVKVSSTGTYGFGSWTGWTKSSGGTVNAFYGLTLTTEYTRQATVTYNACPGQPTSCPITYTAWNAFYITVTVSPLGGF